MVLHFIKLAFTCFTFFGLPSEAQGLKLSPPVSLIARQHTKSMSEPTENEKHGGAPPATGHKIYEKEPLAPVLQYHHAALGVSDFAASRAFYAKLGFTPNGANDNDKILSHHNGMSLHLFQANKPVVAAAEDYQNILMDLPTLKYNGHTHLSFSVPTVPGVRTFLEQPPQNITISGERVMPGDGLRAIFCRDPDRTTLEFERNRGEMKHVDHFTAAMIGDTRPMDHVGTRVTRAEDCYLWYAATLGFVNEVMHYPLDTDPLQNWKPFAQRTETGVDINLIVNGNMGDDDTSNHLIGKDGSLTPGILYVAYTVANLTEAIQKLTKAGIQVVQEDAMETLGLTKDHAYAIAGAPSIFLTDPHGSIFRLVQATTVA
jgi:catechol 2,3-dioxygenase-like lactoylglutathione lyase family enzyme